MDKKLKLSVIITSYNDSKYIRECVDSVLKQTYKPYEIVVADDCSSDGTQDILKQYENNYDNIKIIFNPENLGAEANRDKAIRKAKGDLITTLDGDNYFISDEKLENEMELIKENYDDNVMALSNICIVDGKGGYLGKKSNFKQGYLLYDIITRNISIPTDFIFPKNLYYKAGGFDKNIPVYEDWDLVIRMSKYGYFKYTGKDGIAYRQHGAGISQQTDKKTKMVWMKHVFKKNISLIDNYMDMLCARYDFGIFVLKAFIVRWLEYLGMKKSLKH